MSAIVNLLEELKGWAKSERPIDLVVQGVEQGRGLMMQRVFNDKKGTKDVKGQGLGGYSNSYAKVRKAAGRQAKRVDLTFTESLFRDVKLVRNGKQITIAIPSAEERQKVKWIEQYYKKNIFDLSAKEEDQVKKVIKQNMDADYNEIIQTYFR